MKLLIIERFSPVLALGSARVQVVVNATLDVIEEGCAHARQAKAALVPLAL